MKCPTCKKDMKIKYKDTSTDSRNGKQYNRTYFICEKDDIYVTLEIPKNE